VSELDSNFELLLGRQPTDAERQQLYRVRDALKLQPSDSIWLLLMVLGHYETLYAKFPALIASAAKETLTNLRDAAKAQAAAAGAETQKALATAVQQVALETSLQTAATQLWKWVVIGASVLCLALIATGAWCFAHGEQKGFANGVVSADQRCRNEAAAASWANTPEGELAYGLATAGSLHQVATCKGDGWELRDGICYPRPDPKGRVTGWRVDADAAARNRAPSAIDLESLRKPRKRR
jgi:hypothetical protein